jgi:hypothetical protein
MVSPTLGENNLGVRAGHGLGFRDESFGAGDWGLKERVKELWVTVCGYWFTGYRLGFRVWGLGFRVHLGVCIEH